MTSPLARARALRDAAEATPETVDPATIRTLLSHPESRVRRTATTALLYVLRERPAVGTDFVERLTQLLARTDAADPSDEADSEAVREQRERLLRCLAHVAAADPDAVRPACDAVLARIEAPEPDANFGGRGDVNAAATVCLVQVVEVDAAPLVPHLDTLGRLLVRGTPPTRRHVAHLLTAVGDDHPAALTTVASPLRRALRDDDTQTVQKSAAAVGHLAARDPEATLSALPDLLALLAADEAGVRANAAGVVAELVPAASDRIADDGDRLTALLEDPAAPVRRHATAVFARLAAERGTLPSPADGGLIELLDDPDPTVRKNVCAALGHLETPGALSLLRVTATTDGDPAVRESAAWAIDRIS